MDGIRHTMTSEVVTVPVLGADGRISTVRGTLYRTPDGPVIEQPGVYDWTTSTAYVVHDAEADNLRSLNELLAIGKPQTLGQLHAAMHTYQGLPDLNVFAVDAQGTADYVDAVRTALADAVDDLASHHLALDTPLGALQRVSTADGPIPMHGCVNACYDTVGPDSLELTAAGVYEDVSTGASFLMVSELSPGDVHTRTVLTYGESDNPASPHHWDQARLFSAKQWVTDRFTDAEITADPHVISTVLRDLLVSSRSSHRRHCATRAGERLARTVRSPSPRVRRAVLV